MLLTRLRAASGPVALAGLADRPIGLGAAHPLAHGSLRLDLDVDAGGVIHRADVHVGLLHRGAERLFHARDYRQILSLANRHDWLGSVGGEIVIALAVEDATGIAPPPRATWIRTLLLELTRAANHLAFLESFPLASSSPPLRERLISVMERATGGRMHPMITCVGGVRFDLPDGWEPMAADTIADVSDGLAWWSDFLQDQAVRERLDGLGPLSDTIALSHGASGPVARASGVDLDLRRDTPLLAYAELGVQVSTRSRGAVLDRVAVLAEECAEALRLATMCLARLEHESGPISIRLPKVLRVPDGETYAAIESPLGVTGAYLVSRGDKVPWRLALRTPSFAHAGLLSSLLVGTRVDDLELVLASVPMVMGDVEK